MLKPQDWKEELLHVLESSQQDDPAEVIKGLNDLADAMGDDVADALLDAYPDLFNYADALTKANYRRILTKDTVETRRLLAEQRSGSVKFKDVASKSAIETYNRVSGMFDHVDFHDCRRFVMVGCGPMPATVFHVHDRTEVPEIVGLDMVPEAVKTARELADRLGYTRAKIELADGRSYDYGEAQIVFVANMVFGKSSVVSRIADTASQRVQIVVRDSYSLGRLWAENAARNLDQRLECVAMSRKDGYVSRSRDLYLRRRDQAHTPLNE